MYRGTVRHYNVGRKVVRRMESSHTTEEVIGLCAPYRAGEKRMGVSHEEAIAAAQSPETEHVLLWLQESKEEQ